MTARLAAAGAALLVLGGCATGSTVKLFNGENGNPTGAVAVLDPETGEDRGLINQANSNARVNGGRSSIRKFDEASLNASDRQTLEFLPPPLKRYTVYFYRDSPDLTQESLDEMKSILFEINRRPGAEIAIIGHTDSAGTSEYNIGLSLDRATQVQTILVDKLGIPRSATSIAARGERDPIPGHEGNGRADPVNRRVEILVR